MLKILFPPILVIIFLFAIWLVLFSLTEMHYYVLVAMAIVSFMFLLFTSHVVPFLLNCRKSSRVALETTLTKKIKNISKIENKIYEIAENYGIKAPKFLVSIGDTQVNSLAIDSLLGGGSVIIFTESSLEHLKDTEINLMVEYHMYNIAYGNSLVETFNSSIVSFLNVFVLFFTFGLLKISSNEDFNPKKIVYALSYITTIPFVGILKLMSPNSYQVDADAHGVIKGRYVSGGSDLLERMAVDTSVSRCEAIPLFAGLYYSNPLRRPSLNKRADSIYFDRLNNIFFCQALVRNYLTKKLGLLDLGINISKIESGKKYEETVDFVDSRALQRRMRLDMFKRSLQEAGNLNPARNVYRGKNSIGADLHSSKFPWSSQDGSSKYKFIEQADMVANQKKKFENYKMNKADVETVWKEFKEKKPVLKKASGK